MNHQLRIFINNVLYLYVYTISKSLKMETKLELILLQLCISFIGIKQKNLIHDGRFNRNNQNLLTANNRFLGADVLKPILQG